MNYCDETITFSCAGDTLVGVLTSPRTADVTGTTAVLVIVGGPQYRAGSHRQFTQISRALAAAGFPVLRFDYRGMGDSMGDPRDFLQVTADIGAAIDALQEKIHTIKQVVLWGLCDAASAALLYCHDTRDARVCGLCLLNPWVRSEASLARAHVKHYYADRLRQKEFWLKLLSGKVAATALTGLWKNLTTALRPSKVTGPDALIPFQIRMAAGWKTPGTRILVILSGKDYTANEFIEFVGMDIHWKGLLDHSSIRRRDLPDADHTFTDSVAQDLVETLTLEWLNR